MKYTIDEAVCKNHSITLAEVLAILLLKECNGDLAFILSHLCQTEKVVPGNLEDIEEAAKLYPTMHWDDEVCSVLLESDKTVPESERIKNLVSQMRELFPKGMKIGSASWRGNMRELTLRMQKFFKIYGDFSDEKILEATKRYVESFNGNYTYMRILKYFILKSETKSYVDDNGNPINQIEEMSELANFLENEDESSTNKDWQVQMR